MATVLRRLMVSAGWSEKSSPTDATRRGDSGSAVQLEEDRIDYDSWLLPPVPPTPAERSIRRISTVLGPVLLAIVAALLLWLIVA